MRSTNVFAKMVYDVPAPSRMHGSWTFYFDAPGGFMVEVLC